MAYKILFVDDEFRVTQALERAVRKERFEVFSAHSAQDAMGILNGHPIDIVLSDEMMPGISGSEFLTWVYQNYPDTIRIMLTGHANLETALRAINEASIFRFLTKPCSDAELRITIHQAIQQRELIRESRRLLKTVRKQHVFLHELEKENPGISRLEVDQTGAILLDEVDYDMDGLIRQMNEEVQRCERLLPSSLRDAESGRKSG